MDSPFRRSSKPTGKLDFLATPTPLTCPNEETTVISTPEIQDWMSSIEQWLNEVCIISTEGKLNSEQKLRISNLCRRVAHGTSQMAVQYQSLKVRIVRSHDTIQSLEEQHDLSQCLKDLKMKIEDKTIPASGSSFADMVKKGANNFVQPANISSVAIYPSDKLKSSEQTKCLVQKIISPEQMQLKVRGLRKTKNGGVIISTESKDDIEKVKQTVQQSQSGLTVDEPQKRKPRVIVIGVPTNMQEQEVFKCLYNQNLAGKLQNTTLETFLTSSRLSHKSGKKDSESCNYVIEVTAAIRKALITKERVFINWSSCPVRDFTLVTRCYKCQQYGHAAKSCRETSHTCKHCGKQGHSIQECTRKAEDPKCATCTHYNKPNNHDTGSADCPAKLMAEKRYINSVDYGVA